MPTGNLFRAYPTPAQKKILLQWTFHSYKARKAGKLVIKVPPHYSSEECARCGHVHPDNRPSRAEFVCQRCGLTDNADYNASRVIARRGIRLFLEAF